MTDLHARVRKRKTSDETGRITGAIGWCGRPMEGRAELRLRPMQVAVLGKAIVLCLVTVRKVASYSVQRRPRCVVVFLDMERLSRVKRINLVDYLM
jgi:hypothetical protein